MKHHLFIGIDVAMKKHDCCIMDKDSNILIKKFAFDNTLLGYQKPTDRVTSHTSDISLISFGMEVTSIYGDNLYECLKIDSFNVIMIRPESVKKYCNYIELPKNDMLDAKCITEILVRDVSKSVFHRKRNMLN